MTVPRRLAMFALVAGLAVITAHTWAQRAASAAAPPNFDVRTERAAGAAAYLARYTSGGVAGARAAFADARAAGLARLQATFKDIEVVDSPELGTPEIIGVKPGTGFLTGATTDRVGAMRGFLSSHAEVYGLSQDQIASLELVADYVNPAGNMAWVEFEQKINGLPVFRGLVRGGFTASGELARTTGPLAAGLDAAALSTSPTLTAAQAVAQAAANVGWRVDADALVQTANDGGKLTFSRATMADEPTAWLQYFPLAPGVARLAWATVIWGDPDAFMILLDAEDGTVLFRKNLTDYQSQPATYVVYNDDSPAPLSPTSVLPGSGTQAPFIARTPFTLIGNEGANFFNNLGWMTDGTNFTDGNNVEAGVDLVAPDGVDAPVPGAARVFDFGYNPQTDEAATAPYQNGEVTDTFYWTNTYHDRLYLLGFTEAARNFQTNNFGRGGVGNDRVRAEAQDFSGTNNANFSTAPDGTRGRMQMYIFPGPTPKRSSGLDHDVLLHELTHGTSNRLHGNASGLNNQMSGGMGEGWSDFYARALLSSAAEDPNGIYNTGGWVTYQFLTPTYTSNYYYGIRRFPYASISNVYTNGKPHNPETFADIDPTQINLSNGAFSCNPLFSCSSSASEVHNVGEIWASALLEVRARFITRLGFAVGNQRVLQFITDGMKLDPVGPTLLQGRDSIVAAANAGGGTAADIFDIRAGFAARGMGVGAQVVNASTFQVVESFTPPGIAAAAGTLVSESIPNGRLDAGEVVGVSLCMTNQGLSTSGSVTGTLAATGGVTSPSGPQVYGPIAAGGNVCRTFTLTVGSACGATLTATVQAAESGGPTGNLTYTFQVGSPGSAFFSQNFDGVTAPALPSGWTSVTLNGGANPWVTQATTSPDTAPNRAFVNDPIGVTDNALVSPAIAMPAGVSTLTFRQNFITDDPFDGGVLEIRIGAGAFQDIITAGGTFVTGGYTGTLNGLESNPLGVRQAWTGSTGSSNITTTVRLPLAAGGQNIVLRWRMGTGLTFGAPGWSIDTVTIAGSLCSTPSRLRTSDFDGDGKADIAVFRPSNGTWYIVNSSTGLPSGFTWGNGNDRLVPGDYDGDGKTDFAIFRPSDGGWYIVRSSTGVPVGTVWGNGSDIPVPGDYDGDGKTDIAVFRPSDGGWYVIRSSTGVPFGFLWGNGADIPVPGDYDGDGKTDIAIFRPSDGGWYIVRSTTGVPYGFVWGNGADKPVAADYDGDGKTDIAIFRPSDGGWYIVRSTTGVPVGTVWGNGQDIPVPGDYDGDGKTDIAIFRPSDGGWYVIPSTTGVPFGYVWGNGNDIPILRRP